MWNGQPNEGLEAHSDLVPEPDYRVFSASNRRPEAFWLERSISGKFAPHSYDPGAKHPINGRRLVSKRHPGVILEDPSDLRNLRFVSPQAVQQLLVELEQLVLNGHQKIVGILNTGGTISMLPTPQGILQPSLDVRILIEHAGPRLQENWGFAGLSFPHLLCSSEMELDYIADLVIAQFWVWKNASPELRKHLLGYLTLLGTDTLDEAGPDFSMMQGPDCPYSTGLVSAQGTIIDRFSDVACNIRFALDTLDILSEQKKQTTFLYSGANIGGAYSAVAAIKVSDRKVRAFDSPAHSLLIDAESFGADGIRSDFLNFYQPKSHDRYFPIILRGHSNVSFILARMKRDPLSLVRLIETAPEPFIVLQGFGCSTIGSKELTAVIRSAQLHGKVVFATERLPGGRDDHRYESAEKLRKSGAHLTHMLPNALESKLVLAEHLYRNDIERIAHFVTRRNYVGEFYPNNWRSIPAEDQAYQSGSPADLYDFSSIDPMNFPPIKIVDAHAK